MTLLFTHFSRTLAALPAEAERSVWKSRSRPATLMRILSASLDSTAVFAEPVMKTKGIDTHIQWQTDRDSHQRERLRQKQKNRNRGRDTMKNGCGTWWRFGWDDDFQLEGREFDSRSSHHVGTLGKSFTYSCLCASASNSDTVSVL